MTEIKEKEAGSSSKFVNFIKGLIRFILILLILAMIGFGLYFGGKLLYEQTLVRIEANRTEISKLAVRQKSSQEQVDQRLLDFNGRLTDLEDQKAIETEKMAEMSSDITHLEKLLDDHTAAFGKIDQLEQSLQAVEENLAAELAERSEFEASLTAEDSPIAALQQEVAILKAMELLSRARLYMLQNNYGLAGRDIQSAGDVLEKLLGLVPPTKAPIAQDLIDRVDNILEYLPGFPVMAADELEIVWRTLANGLNEESVQPYNFNQNGDKQPPGLPASTPEAEASVTPTEGPPQTPAPSPTPTPAP